MKPRVLSAILFSPRGGSAHAARALAGGLRNKGWDVTLVAGSRRDLGLHGNARAFYGEVRPVDFDAALASDAPQRFEAPPGSAPLHPSFEDRPGAPDRVFAVLDDHEYELQVAAWSRELAHAGAPEMDVLHLHHLTPLNEAAARVAPHVPIVGQLHGTELLMLERMTAEDPPAWPFAARWATRIRGWAQECTRLVLAPAGVERAVTLLEVPPQRVVAMPNGVDLDLFTPTTLDRRAFWRRVLVEQPQGWLPGEPPGSVGYREEDVRALADGVVLLYVGRFTAVKRLDRLIAAFGRVQRRLEAPAGLVLVGGHPGEWEGEHPAQIAARLDVPQVFLAGWQSHDALPTFFSAADAIVLASEREQFGQVLVEGMACGLPAVATRSVGPAAIVEDGHTGWLVDPDDESSLDAALTDVVTNQVERERRGRLARKVVRERYSWTRAAERLASVLEEAAGEGTPPERLARSVEPRRTTGAATGASASTSHELSSRIRPSETPSSRAATLAARSGRTARQK
jgi:glycosyltransferase involved in cell wall biosynthesis